MIVGSFGKVTFQTSSMGVTTFKQIDRTRSYTFGEHKVVHGVPYLQHTGRELETIELPIIMDNALNPTPYYDCDKIKDSFVEMAQSGDHFSLVIGLTYHGEWVITSMKEVDKIIIHGVTVRMDLSLSLKEYH